MVLSLKSESLLNFFDKTFCQIKLYTFIEFIFLVLCINNKLFFTGFIKLKSFFLNVFINSYLFSVTEDQVLPIRNSSKIISGVVALEC